MFGVERDWGVGEDFLNAVGFGVAADFFFYQADEALFDEGFDRGGRAFTEVGEGHLVFRRVGEQGEDGGLLGGALVELGKDLGRRRGVEDGELADFGGVVFGADGFRQQGADDAFDPASVVAGDPAAGFEQLGGDQRFGIAERVERAEGEAEVLGGDKIEHGAVGKLVAQRDADAAAGHDRQAIGDGVVEDELGRAVDEDACGGHRVAGF